jgi:hypothetical protein
MNLPMHAYQVRPGKDHRGFDLISDVQLMFGCYQWPNVR